MNKNQFPTSFNKMYQLDNELNYNSHYRSEREDIVDHLNFVLLIGDLTKLTKLKNELESNGVSTLMIEKPKERFIVKHLFQIDVIVTCFDTLEMTMDVLKGNKILKSLFIPVIVYSRLNSPFSRKVSYLHGVDDYVPTFVDIYEVLIRINNQIERKEQLNTSVFTDQLTQSYNRKYLTTIFLQQIYLNNSFIFALIDFDNFRRINNDFSYIIGDKILKKFAKDSTKYIDSKDTIVRLGGDEFALLLPFTTTKVAKEKVNNMLNDLSNIHIQYNANFKCTFSAGILQISSDTGLETAIEQAQVLLKQSKRKGKNQICAINQSQSI